MITRKQTKVIRLISVTLLAVISLAVVICADVTARRSVDRTRKTLQYGYSDEPLENKAMPDDPVADILFAIDSADKKYDVSEDFLLFCANDKNINTDGRFLTFAKTMFELMEYSDELWMDLTGYGFSVLYDLYTGAAVNGDVEVLGNVYDQHKTVIAVSFDGGDYGDIIGDAGITLGCCEDGVRYVISGGVKLALCVGAESDALIEAEASSDVMLAYTDRNSVEDAILAGADAVFVADSECEPYIDAEDGVFVVYGMRSTETSGAAVVTVSVSAGVDPVLRYYPVIAVDGEIMLPDGAAMASILELLNARSDTAVVGDDFRVKRK